MYKMLEQEIGDMLKRQAIFDEATDFARDELNCELRSNLGMLASATAIGNHADNI